MLLRGGWCGKDGAVDVIGYDMNACHHRLRLGHCPLLSMESLEILPRTSGGTLQGGALQGGALQGVRSSLPIPGVWVEV